MTVPRRPGNLRGTRWGALARRRAALAAAVNPTQIGQLAPLHPAPASHRSSNSLNYRRRTCVTGRGGVFQQPGHGGLGLIEHQVRQRLRPCPPARPAACCSPSSSPPPRHRGPRRRTPTPGRTAGSFSTIRLVWANSTYPGRLLIWAKDVLTLTMQIIKRIPGATGFRVRPRIWVVEKFRADQQAPPRCATTKPDPTTTKPSSTSP